MDLHRMAWLCTIICFAHVYSFPTNCILQKHLMKRSYTLLDTMGGLFPAQCLEDDVSVTFPQNVFDSNKTQQDGVEKAIYQTLQNIDALFENDGVPDKWNEEKLDGFLHTIYRQINDSKCILSKSEDGQDLDKDAALKVYFDTISANMKQKNFSYCAWEVVRKEVLRILDYILNHNTDNML
ncbi:interferon phi 3 precursor [Triplophysa rosa]|uniref:Interferon phi 3 n=2 Tax=Triplophysa rosa TaxID=992332 RepID=A0A9W7WLM2_TRIRA|nr:interferon phi 3 precursor [Triplophysa rosa]